MSRFLHISYSFDSVDGASISASLHDGMRLEGVWDWRRTLVRKAMRVICVPMDVSAGVVWYGLKEKISNLRPDRVFIHWIGHEMLRYEELECLAGIPVTIVLHDFSLFEVPPYRRQTWFDCWRLKRIGRVLSKLDIDFEAPSNWAAKHIKELRPEANVVVRRTPIRDDFCKRAGEKCYQNNGCFRLLFGCQGGRRNPYKGFNDLEAALDILTEAIKQNMELHVFGESSDECLTSGVKTVFHGEIEKADELGALYRMSDALAFPSLSETQGIVKDEALACGLKVITFNRTACPEGILHKENGYIASDVQDFAKGILWAMKPCGE